MAMRPSAMGLDGWSLQDLRALPDRVLQWLAQLLTLIEGMGQWPTLLAQGYTSLIPKPGEEGPLGTRPLTVLSMVFRLWAGTRLCEVMRWQEAWVHPRACGFRLARGAVDAATVTQVLLELARLKGWRLEGLSFDYVKCFDLIPQAVVLRIARELGMDDGCCAPWRPCIGSSGGRSAWRGRWGRGGTPPTASCRAARSASF